jgi:hypothetical protein
LFLKEFTEAVARIMKAHEAPSLAREISMEVIADEIGS